MLLAIADKNTYNYSFKSILKSVHRSSDIFQVGMALLFTLHGFTEFQSWLNRLSIGEKPVKTVTVEFIGE